MSAHKKQSSKFKWHPKPVPFSTKVRSALSRVWVWVVSAGVLLGFWAVWAEAAPVLHVDPFREFNPATPFSEGFKVSNDGKLDLYNLKFYCHTIHVKVGTNNFYGSNQLDAQPWKVRTIPASGNITIYCPLESSIYSDDHGQTKYAKTQIGFRVRFQHLLHPWGTQTCFQFLGVPDYTDTLQWTYLNNDCPTDIKDYP